MERLPIEIRLDALPAAYRTVFVLCVLEEVSSRDVAQLLGMSEQAVRVCHSHAKTLLGVCAENVQAARRDTYVFGGERCERIVREVSRRLGHHDR